MSLLTALGGVSQLPETPEALQNPPPHLGVAMGVTLGSLLPPPDSVSPLGGEDSGPFATDSQGHDEKRCPEHVRRNLGVQEGLGGEGRPGTGPEAGLSCVLGASARFGG